MCKPARLALSIVLIGAISLSAYLAFWRANLKRFAIVREGVLIRSGQPTEFGLKHLVRYHGVKTILSLRQENDLIHIGAFDGGEPSGRRESEVVSDLKATYLHWPMGGEAYWPWLPPKQFEEFFELFDNAENLPVAVHCVAGRHRTGTLSALYRLEYDRWPVDRVLKEIHSFDFGEPIPVQLVNLLTYTPRPRPSADDWPVVREQFAAIVPQSQDYESLMQFLLRHEDRELVAKYVVQGVEAKSPFGLTVARRMISTLPAVVQKRIAVAAGELIAHPQRSSALSANLSAAAAIVADFGSHEDQHILFELLTNHQTTMGSTDSQIYESIVRGIADRYTPNRLAYVRVLLNDERPLAWPDTRSFRYCDLAVARLTGIVNERFVDELPPVEGMWDRAVTSSKAWFDKNIDAQQLTQRVPPIEHRMAMDALRLEQDGGDRFR